MSTPNAFATQVGGDHYKHMAIQPMTFALANRLDMATASAIKYLVRRKDGAEGRARDLSKAIHCIQLLAAHEGIALNVPVPSVSVTSQSQVRS